MTEILLHLARTLNRQFQSQVDIFKIKCPSKIREALERRSLMLFRTIDFFKTSVAVKRYFRLSSSIGDRKFR